MINDDNSFETSAMTEAQHVQFDRFLDFGFSEEDAHLLVERGAWLSSLDMTEKDIADARRYRAERDASRSVESKA